jgi:hypothetical protein
MKLKTKLALVGGALPLIASAQANADYTGLSVELHTTVVAFGQPKFVYRVYANFDNENDFFTHGAGSELLGPLTIESRNSDDSGPGSNFFNPGGASGNTAPTVPTSPNYWGTYVTVGISDWTQVPPSSIAGSQVDQTTLSPGFPNFIVGNQLANSNMAWFTAGPVEQGRAGFFGDKDAQLRVQIMQLTVNAGHHVRGTLAVGVWLDGASEGMTFANQTFNSIPAPGALGLIGAAGLIRRRRRR